MISAQAGAHLGVEPEPVVEKALAFSALDCKSCALGDCARCGIVHAVSQFQAIDVEFVVEMVDETAQSGHGQSVTANTEIEPVGDPGRRMAPPMAVAMTLPTGVRSPATIA